MGLITYVIVQMTCLIGSFSVCYVGQLLIDEVNYLLLMDKNIISNISLMGYLTKVLPVIEREY